MLTKLQDSTEISKQLDESCQCELYIWLVLDRNYVQGDMISSTCKDGFGCLFECQIFGHFSSIMDK